MARLLLPEKDPHAVSALRNKRSAIAGEIVRWKLAPMEPDLI
jgi:hypothetical protein